MLGQSHRVEAGAGGMHRFVESRADVGVHEPRLRYAEIGSGYDGFGETRCEILREVPIRDVLQIDEPHGLSFDRRDSV